MDEAVETTSTGPRDDVEAALAYCRRLPRHKLQAWVAAWERIMDGEPEDLVYFELFRSFGYSAQRARERIAEANALPPGAWREMLS